MSERAPWLESVAVRCECGEDVLLRGDSYTCACGRVLGTWDGEKAVVGKPIPYWGELPAEQMQRLLDQSLREGWRSAVSANVDAAMCHYIMSPERAAFEHVIPFPDDALILDLGAGMGGIAAELARKYRVIALEGVAERASFIAVRANQDGLAKRLAVVNGDVKSTRFAPGQFDAAIVNGLLEWVGLFDLTRPVMDVQVGFLESVRQLLKPGGLLYVGIENRIGWDQLRGVADHSGLRYTSLLPRFLANWVCRWRSPGYRSEHNTSYRTFTYSYRGYSKLFRRAGLRIRSTYISPLGYNCPTELVPLEGHAIHHHVRMRIRPANGLKRHLINLAKQELARKWVWTMFGTDFVFLLEAIDA